MPRNNDKRRLRKCGSEIVALLSRRGAMSRKKFAIAFQQGRTLLA
jgi:hypothetical protein